MRRDVQLALDFVGDCFADAALHLELRGQGHRLAAAIKTSPCRVKGKGDPKPRGKIKPIDGTCVSTQNSSRSSHFAWTINWTDAKLAAAIKTGPERVWGTSRKQLT